MVSYPDTVALSVIPNPLGNAVALLGPCAVSSSHDIDGLKLMHVGCAAWAAVAALFGNNSFEVAVRFCQNVSDCSTQHTLE